MNDDVDALLRLQRNGVGERKRARGTEAHRNHGNGELAVFDGARDAAGIFGEGVAQLEMEAQVYATSMTPFDEMAHGIGGEGGGFGLIDAQDDLLHALVGELFEAFDGGLTVGEVSAGCV